MDNGVTELEDFGKRWARAEIAGDVPVLDSLATKDFALVVVGFRLGQGTVAGSLQQWRLCHHCAGLARYQVRVLGDCAIVVGVHDQESAHRGQPSNGQFRATHILVREGGTWRLAGMHLSPIAAPPRAPQ
jgi:ketosteroid isomerase-like protein